MYSKPPLLVASVVIFVVAIVLFFNRNIVINGFKKLLNSLGVYTEVIKNVEITSTNYGDPGSWHIDKSAIWTGPGKAQITFDLNTMPKNQSELKYDVILALDVSVSMTGDKISSLRSSARRYINEVLDDKDNNIAIVDYNTYASILSNFSNNKTDLLSKINNLDVKCDHEIIDGIEYDHCNTNYYDALVKVENVLKNYHPSRDRQLVVLFLTDGNPNKDTDLIEGQYEVLKDKYPNIIINGIQYEMGSVISHYLQKASDYQFDAYKDTIYDVFFKSTYQETLLNYENFEISDYIEDEYFSVNSVDDVTVSRGTVKLEEENGVQKVVWNLSSELFKTGESAKMRINVNLKDKYLGTSKFLPTNKKEEIIYKIEDEGEKEVKSTKTPVLKHSYDVIYDTNTPAGCQLTAIPKESHYVYETVTKKSNQLTCPGYLFRGWEIDGKDFQEITIVNDDSFIMPEHNVTIRATWSKQSVDKSMTGTVRENVTLYKVLQDEAESSGLAREYTGTHQDSINGVGKEKIYHYYAETNEDGISIQNKNNVIFAGMCWQMIRTTDTGGVKMIYNGEPDSKGKCGTDRGTHIGYGMRSSANLSNSNYYYGTSYTYNSSTKMFSLAGTKTLSTWDATTGPTLVGQYTCMSANQYDTCETLYYVESVRNDNRAYVLPLNSSAEYSDFGTIKFNEENNSLAYAGYMYNAVYPFQEKSILASNYTYAKSFTYSNGTYRLTNGVTNADFYDIHDFDNLIGTTTTDKITKLNNAHYTCFNTTGECTTISYIFNVNRINTGSSTSIDLTADYIGLSGGESVEDALNKMLKADNVNSTNSTIKNAIDAWYERYMLNYADYLEDIIYCNDRSVSVLGGLNPNGGSIIYGSFSGTNDSRLYFSSGNKSNNLSCPNITDRFSVSNTRAKLKYPVGLISSPEINLLNHYSSAEKNYWKSTPINLMSGTLYLDGGMENSSHYYIGGVRPAISLVAGTGYSNGDGTMDHPYIVE